MTEIVISGTGFRGFCDCLALLDEPGLSITMIDTSPVFGGIAHSRNTLGFWVDNGVHVFDAIPTKLANLIAEIMEGQVSNFPFSSCSAFNQVVTDGFSLPDLSSLEPHTKQKIKQELLASAALKEDLGPPTTLDDLFQFRFGATAGNIFSQIFERIYGTSSKNVDPVSLSVTSLHRLKFLDDEAMRDLKQDPYLDTILAARRQSTPSTNDSVSVYPTRGDGMRGFCEMAKSWLEKRGVRILLGNQVESIYQEAKKTILKTNHGELRADKVVWSNDNHAFLADKLGVGTEIKNYIHGAPMLFMTLVTDQDNIKDFTYIQNFDVDSYTYRTAAAGRISQQVSDTGKSFITCECPTELNGDRWQNPTDQIQPVWEECKALGVIASNAELHDAEVLKIPTTFKPTIVGYNAELAKLADASNDINPNILVRQTRPFFRYEIYSDSQNLPAQLAV